MHARAIPAVREERPQTVWEKGTKEAFRDRPGQGKAKEAKEAKSGRDGEGWSTGELRPVRHLGLPLHSVGGGRVEERKLEPLWVGGGRKRGELLNFTSFKEMGKWEKDKISV